MIFTTARIYALGALALMAMIGFGVYRHSHKPLHAQKLHSDVILSAPASTQSATTQAAIQNDIAALRHELASAPNDPAIQARLAFALISQQQATPEAVQEATTLIENACRQSQFKERKYIEILGQTYAVAGRYDRAVKVGEIVKLMAENADDEEAARIAGVRLEVYRSMLLQQKINTGTTPPASKKH